MSGLAAIRSQDEILGVDVEASNRRALRDALRRSAPDHAAPPGGVPTSANRASWIVRVP